MAEVAVVPARTGVRADEPAVRADEPGVRADEPGVRADEPGVRADEPGVRADELAELYGALAVRLRRIVGCQVRAPDALIEDACQSAWGTLVSKPGQVRRETALGWLVRTASREALKLLRSDRRAVSLEALIALTGPDDAPPWALTASVEEEVEQRVKLASLTRLPERQQRVLWLQGLGFSYAEMATETGASLRTVERQLMRAKRSLRSPH
jgi:RNA polymerase sigma factor (sigma-70 family)